MARPREFDEAAALDAATDCFWRDGFERSLDDRDRRGCLLVSSAVEIAPHDAELGAEIAGRLGEIEAFFRRASVAAQTDGAVPPDRDPGDLARLLLGVTLGVHVLARSNPRRDLLEGAVRPALALLDWPSRPSQTDAALIPSEAIDNHKEEPAWRG